MLFLYIVPLKQGLKREGVYMITPKQGMFLYIVPLKQGLKLSEKDELAINTILFLYIVPLKQGLKLCDTATYRASIWVFIHSSIKTRIETSSSQYPSGIGRICFYT